jgi:hypothetical protein
MKEYKVIVTEHNTQWYNLEGQRHNEHGPAIDYKNGHKWYYINGKCHREDGPAVEYVDGKESYYINGIHLTKEQFNNRTKTCENKVVEIEGVKYKLSKV